MNIHTGRGGAAIVACSAVVFAMAGCSASVSTGSKMSGKEVAAKAEKLMEDKGGASKGTMTCGGLKNVKGDHTRCERTVIDDSTGVQVKLGVTVTVDKPSHIHVKADDAVSEFGITGDALAKTLSAQLAPKLGKAPDDVQCPYLKGQVGAQVTCKAQVDGASHDVQVKVDTADSAKLDMHFSFNVVS